MPAHRFAALFSVLCVAFFLATANAQENNHPYYNIKAGPVYLTLSAQMSTEYTDNVNLASGLNGPLQSDLIVYPSIGLSAISRLSIHPLSETNTSTLGFNINFGYRDHLMHPNLNQNVLDMNVSPDSELSLLIHAGHFKIRLHDGFSLQSDPVTEGALSNVAVFRRFTNTAGVNVEWDFNSRTVINAGYSHSNLFALSVVSTGTTANNLTASNLNNSSDLFSFSASTKIIPEVLVGWGATAQTTLFPGAMGQNSTSYTYGPFTEIRLTEYTTLNASWGVSKNTSNSATATTSNISLTNRLNSYYTQTFSTGQQAQIGIFGEQTAVNYLRYNSVWRMNSHIALSSAFYVEDCTNLSGNNLGSSNNADWRNGVSNYRRYGCDFSTSYQLGRRLTTSLSYRYIKKLAANPFQSYKQNSVFWNIIYLF